MGAIVHIINDELSVELIFGFWQALLVIVILLAFIFRSLRWAIIACIPNLAPPIALLGYLSLTHTPIKPGTAIIFSIALGLAFNNTVYLLNRLTALKNSVHLFPVRKTFYLEGNPCLVSTLIMLVGFSVFLFSYFSINQTFGACMMVSIIGGIIGDLFFLPAFIFLWPESLGRTQMKLKPTPIAASEA
jgi:predicted RND superfamily exporter protein